MLLLTVRKRSELLNNKTWHVIAKEKQNPGFLLFLLMEDDNHRMHSHNYYTYSQHQTIMCAEMWGYLFYFL